MSDEAREEADVDEYRKGKEQGEWEVQRNVDEHSQDAHERTFKAGWNAAWVFIFDHEYSEDTWREDLEECHSALKRYRGERTES
tara:strand:- start:64 stop:315 length:252 start_codon:yes stop_codon:yes gene_type:complete